MSGHRNLGHRRLLGALALGLAALGTVAQGSEIRWLPAAASDNVVCTPGVGECGETQMILSEGGVRVTLLLQVSGWDQDQDGNPMLGAYQGALDSLTLAGGAAENPNTIPGIDLIPVGAPTNMGFEGAFLQKKVCAFWFEPDSPFDPLSRCQSFEDCPEEFQFCVDRPDFVFYMVDNTPTVTTVTANYAWSAASFDCAVDPDGGATKFYGGTFLVDVPLGAQGTYNVGFVASSNYTMVNACPGMLIPGLTRTPGVITIQGDPMVVESTPADQKTLWRSQRNIVRITFDGPLPSTPLAREIKIVELLDGGACGPTLSADFTFEVENDGGGEPTILKIQETGSTLEHRTWYAIRNTGGWLGVADFELQYLVQVQQV